ncbi:MAG: hypothetical protein ACJ8AT_16320 [Hyalangium sp.]|uniref:hypothetical protein n=1 Tax=Hyalangium sp. TaxID=2028555 RepID=UPI00389B24E9
MSVPSDQPAPVLMFFQEIRPGDVRKQRAVSNDDPESGGGARDLRIPQDYKSMLEPMFPRRGSEEGVQAGEIHWVGAEGPEEALIELWPPTTSRPAEIRIALINNIRGWEVDEAAYEASRAARQKWFYVLEKRENGEVWARILKEDAESREPPELREYLRDRIRRTPPSRSIRGAIDFRAKSHYP